MEAGASLSLTITLRGTLRSFPGSTHWHLKRGNERGVLEVTLWPAGRRLWITVQSGRTGLWTEAAAAALRDTLIRALSGSDE